MSWSDISYCIAGYSL